MHTPIQSIHTSGHYMRRIQKVPKAALKKFTPATLLVMLAFSIVPHDHGYGDEYAWVGSGEDNDWSTSGNWDLVAGSILPPPDSAGAVVDFNDSANVGSITVDGNFTLQRITNTTDTISYTLIPGSMSSMASQLFFDNSPVIQHDGSQIFSIQCPIIFGGITLDMNIDPTGSAYTELVGVVDGDTLSMTGTGILNINPLAPSNIGLLQVSSGTVNLNIPGTTPVISMSLSGGTVNSNYDNQISTGTGAYVTYTGNGATWNLNNNDQSLTTFTILGDNTFTQGTGTLTVTDTLTMNPGLLTQNGATIPGNLVFGSTPIISVTGGSTSATIGGNIDLDAGQPHFNVTAGTGTIDLQIDGIISNGALNKNNNGTLVLAGANTYTLGTTVNGGTLALSNTGSLYINNPVIVNTNAIFDVSLAPSPQIAGFSGTGGSVQLGSNTLTLNLVDSPFIYSGSIQDGTDTGSLTIARASGKSQQLNGASTFKGGTTINGGILKLGNSAALLSTGTVTLNNSQSTLDVSLAGGEIGDLSGDSTTIVNLGNKALTVNTQGTPTYSGKIEDGSTGSFIKAGSGTQTLAGPNTYQGGTEINDGILAILSDGNLGNANGILSFNTPGGTLQITANIISSTRDISLSAPGIIDVNSTFSATFSGVISETTPSTLTKGGDGTLILEGDNMYTGGTTVLEGILALKNAGTIGTGSLTLTDTDSTTKFDITQLTPSTGISVTNLTTDTGTTISLGSKTLTISPTTSITCNSKIQDTGLGSGSGGSLIIDGSSGTILTLAGMNTYTGGTTIEQGTLAVANDNNLGLSGAITFGSPGGILEITSAAFTTTARNVHLSGPGRILTDSGVGITFSGVINETVSSSLTKDGDGTLTLTGANGYSGGTTVLEGTLALSASGTIGTGSLTLTNADSTTKFDITQLTPSTGISVTNLATDTGTTISLGSKTLTISPTTSTTCNSVIQDSGIGSGTGGKLVVDGTSLTTLTLTGVNTYTGGTTIDGGTLSLGGYGTIGTGRLTLNDNSETSTFDISGISPATSYLISDVNGDANTFIELGNNNLTITPTAADIYSGVIQDFGLGSLTLSSGTLTLEGVNTYAGGTVVGGVATSGTLNIVSPGMLYSTGPITLNNNSIFNISSGGDQAIGDLNGDTGSGITLGSNTLTLNLRNYDEFDGIITGNTGTGGGSLFVTGNGTLTLTNSSTYSSTTVDTDASLFMDYTSNNHQPTRFYS